jgi:hypothetical protein
MSGRKALYLTMALVVAVLIGAVGGKLHSRYKFKQLSDYQECNDVPCWHLAVRLQAIASVISQRNGIPSYLLIGDSITEFADLPEICGRKPINAGIGFATTATFKDEARRLAEQARPDFVLVALGTNDAQRGRLDGFRDRYKNLISSLADWKVIAVPVPPSPKVPNTDLFNREIAALAVPTVAHMGRANTLDGVHLSAASYIEWKQLLVDSAAAFACSS